ncbi:MAG: nucleotidyltransferase family protein [Candidatus Cloacimonetes bacterium]|nr:nucleotidyltransferase family protein [Candidatus Cloacimonadota bacterium]MBL7149544.1 nucleotidyltransferase family protein [Candidatus Cloacimonadota bacterium]
MQNIKSKEKLEILRELKKTILQDYYVKQIGIFGSYIRGEESIESDLDILVEFEKPIDIIKFMELERTLSKYLNAKVDLVSKKALKTFIGRRILQEVIYV